MARIILGGLAAAVIIFFWGFAAHEALPLGETGFHDIPQEETFSATVKGAVKDPGIYLLPGRSMMRSKSEEERNRLAEKVAKGPTGFMIIHPEGGETSLPKLLLKQFLTNLICSLLAAIVVSQLKPGFVVRLACVTLMGIFGFAMVCVPYWNWYQFPLDFTIAQAIEHTVGWFLAGLALAAIVRPTVPKVVVA